MMTADTTTIQISTENWRELTNLKKSPEETYDDVISRLTRKAKESDCSGVMGDSKSLEEKRNGCGD
jgi:predicted CopG family antitoxin